MQSFLERAEIETGTDDQANERIVCRVSPMKEECDLVNLILRKHAFVTRCPIRRTRLLVSTLFASVYSSWA